MSDERDERLRFAELLMEEAEHSSEIAMRTSLNRAYYALFHLGQTITGSDKHREIRKALSVVDGTLGEEYRYFITRRAWADYPDTHTPLVNADLEALRRSFREDILRARELLERFKELT